MALFWLYWFTFLCYVMVLYWTAVMITWHGLSLSSISSSDPSSVFAVQFGFSALLCSSAILTLDLISPILISSHWWQQHVTQSHVVVCCFLSLFFLKHNYYTSLFCFASQEYVLFSLFFFFSFLKMGTCEHLSLCSSLYADTMYLLSFRLSRC